MAKRIVPVVLAGGSGTRLWPLSRPGRPKQLLPLISSRSMLQETLARLAGLHEIVAPPIIVCSASQRDEVGAQLADQDIEARAIVVEPAARNTAPAVAIAALIAEADAPEEEPILLVLPADHAIDDSARFCGAVEIALAAAAANRLVTFGVVPDRPETGYGYIRAGRDCGGWRVVEAFVEKPDRETAEQYAESQHYLWNSGMFMFGARTYLDALARHAPDMLAPCRIAFSSATTERGFIRLGEAFLDCPEDSIDYAVMEKTENAAVVPLDVGWSDVGSWAALYEVLEKDAAGNVLRGQVAAEDCSGCYIHADSRRVAVIGLEQCVVVETRDAVLVMPRDRAQDLKKLIAAIANEPS